MPGFAKREQAALATLVLGHTGKLPKLRELVAAEEDWRCVLCIRLAALFYRSRNYDSAPPVKLGVNGSAYQLAVPRPWLDANPLTEFDLRTEIEEWQRLGKQLELVGSVA